MSRTIDHASRPGAGATDQSNALAGNRDDTEFQKLLTPKNRRSALANQNANEAPRPPMVSPRPQQGQTASVQTQNIPVVRNLRSRANPPAGTLPSAVGTEIQPDMGVMPAPQTSLQMPSALTAITPSARPAGGGLNLETPVRSLAKMVLDYKAATFHLRHPVLYLAAIALQA